MKPDGIRRSCFRYRRTVHVTTTKTNAATSHSMNTCLVTEKSMPSDRRQMDQRMLEAAVRHVLDDGLAGVELLGGAGRVLAVLL